jgi:Protein of unknown function (DUF1549)/Protein of unknown function (DUF1553)
MNHRETRRLQTVGTILLAVVLRACFSIAGEDTPPAHPLDRIIDAYYVKQNLTKPPTVDEAVFLRRAYLDLVGLLPTTAEQDAFLSDSQPGKRERLVRRLLDDRRAYTDHWLTFFNDLLRNDYAGTGYIDGGRKQITGWLYQALVTNKPYDQFVRELISPTPESEGFINGIRWRGRVNASQTREVQFAQNLSQVFLGINMKCASCHDSFIDDWKLDDAYGLAAILADEPLEVHRCDKPTGKIATPRFVLGELGQIDPALPKAQRLEQTARLLTSPANGRFARTIVNRLWQRLMGRGIVHPVDVMSNPPWSQEVLDYLASHLVDHGYDLKQTLELIATSQAYQARTAAIEEEPQGEEFVFRGPMARRLTAEQFLDCLWQITGTGPAKRVALIGDAAPEASVGGGVPAVRASLVTADPLMRALGRPNREQVVTTRPDLLTTLEALDLSNGQILADTLERGAANLLKSHGPTPEKLVEHVYRSALCRMPTADERAVAVDIVGSLATADGLADLLWVVVTLPEFQLVR